MRSFRLGNILRENKVLSVAVPEFPPRSVPPCLLPWSPSLRVRPNPWIEGHRPAGYFQGGGPSSCKGAHCLPLHERGRAAVCLLESGSEPVISNCISITFALLVHPVVEW